MKYSIFHTSNCGSTLLATLLRNSIETYSEPTWIDKIYLQKTDEFLGEYNYEKWDDIVKRKKLFHKDNTLVKYPSYASFLSNVVSGKKIFLYRDLRDHMEKITSQDKGNTLFRRISYHYEIFKLRNLYPDVKPKNDIQKMAFVWAHHLLDISKSQNVLFLKSNDFFLHPIEIVNKVTKFFDITPVKDFDPLSFHVKKDFLRRDEPLDEIIVSYRRPFKVKKGYVKSDRWFKLEDWCYENFDFLPNFLSKI
tara:strand:+ start:1798 stop:2547 length:750 start_codon:yes stop_codon:yes gene_type:complete